MNLIIKIPKDRYKDVIEAQKHHLLDSYAQAIANGTPIPDNATNGDVIMAMFPSIKYEEGYVYVKSNIHKNVIMTVREDWWNTPYQKGGK